MRSRGLWMLHGESVCLGELIEWHAFSRDWSIYALDKVFLFEPFHSNIQYISWMPR